MRADSASVPFEGNIRCTSDQCLCSLKSLMLDKDPQILVKLLVLGGFPFWVLLEYNGNYLMGYVFFSRVYVINPSAPSFLHIQKLGYWLLCDDYFDSQDKGNYAMVAAVCKSPEFLNEESVDWTVESLEVISPSLFLQFCSEINVVAFQVFKVH